MSIKYLLTMLDTSNSNNYQYLTKHLEIHILGGIKTNKLESMRITLSIQKLKNNNVLRHTLDLYPAPARLHRVVKGNKN